MNSTLFKYVKIAGFILLACISTWWTATSIYISGQQGTPLIIWVLVFFILSLIAAYIGLGGVKSQIQNSNTPSIVKLFGFAAIWIIFWGFSFATNVHRNVISQYGYNNVNAQLQSCKQYIDKQLYKTEQTNENKIKSKKDEIVAKINGQMELFSHNMHNTDISQYGFGPTCINILNGVENLLTVNAIEFHDPKIYSNIYDEHNDKGYYGEKDGEKLKVIEGIYNKRVSDALQEHLRAIDNYYKGVVEDTKVLNNLRKSVEMFENSEEFVKADESKDIDDIYICYQKFKKEIIDKMPKKYMADSYVKVADEEGNMRYDLYPSDRMFNFANVWKDWWNDELPKDISLTGQFWLSFLIDFATYLLV